MAAFPDGSDDRRLARARDRLTAWTRWAASLQGGSLIAKRLSHPRPLYAPRDGFALARNDDAAISGLPWRCCEESHHSSFPTRSSTARLPSSSRSPGAGFVRRLRRGAPKKKTALPLARSPRVLPAAGPSRIMLHLGLEPACAVGRAPDEIAPLPESRGTMPAAQDGARGSNNQHSATIMWRG